MQEFPAAFSRIQPSLRRGVPIDEIKQAAAWVAEDPALLKALLNMLQLPDQFSKIEIQKAAWVVNHAFQLDDRGFLLLRSELGNALDATRDVSALRELLKVLAHAVWLDVETSEQRLEAFELASGLLYLSDVPVAIHYAAMQMMRSRAQDRPAIEAALEALAARLNEQPSEGTPLGRCIVRHEQRLRQKLARTKSPS